MKYGEIPRPGRMYRIYSTWIFPAQEGHRGFPVISVWKALWAMAIKVKKRKSFIWSLSGLQWRCPVGSGYVVMKQPGGHHTRLVHHHHWGPAIKRVFRKKGQNTCWMIETPLMTSVKSSYTELIISESWRHKLDKVYLDIWPLSVTFDLGLACITLSSHD